MIACLGLLFAACADNNNDNNNNASCGDGKVDPGEGCDDGNTLDGDGCEHNCMVGGCGDGAVAGGEQCDDGNTTSGDGCDNNCKPTGCGNGVMTSGEACDDGNTSNGDGCDSNCTASGCGNGVTSSGEQCDDGNTTSLDGCSATCATENVEIEPNEDGTISTGGTDIAGNDFARTAADANGAIDAATTIYAHLTPAGDEDVFKVTNSGTQPMTVRFDVWNMATGFGVGVPCAQSIDTGLNLWTSEGTAPVTSNDDRDGDTDRCSGLTFSLEAGQSVYAHVVEFDDDAVIATYALDVKFMPIVCGDGSLGIGEQCDDSNTNSNDGCSSTCQLEGAVTEIEPNEDGTLSTGGTGTGGNDFGSANADTNGAFTSDVTIAARLTPAGDEDVFKFTNTTTTPAKLTLDVWNLAPSFGIGVACGSSIDTGMHVRNAAGASLASNDDRNGSSDRCSSLVYLVPPGQSVYAHVSEYDDDAAITSYALVATLTPVVCGDNDVGLGEQCDDGNTASGDGCSATCQREAICGNSTLDAGEQCDDGNTANADGCSSTCQLEGSVSEVEPNEDGTPSVGGSGTNGNDFASANAHANGAFTGSVVVVASVGAAGDEDVFEFTNSSAAAVSVTFDIWNLAPNFGIGVSCGTSIDTVLRIRDAAGTSLASNDDRSSSDRCSALTFSLAAGQTVYAHLIEYGDNAAIASYALKAVYTP